MYSLPEHVSSELRRTEAAMTHYAHIIPSETYSTPVTRIIAPLVERLAHEVLESVRDHADAEDMSAAIAHTLSEINAAVHWDDTEGHYGAAMMLDYLGCYSYSVKLATLLRIDRVLRRYARIYGVTL
jgi:hypothetical protein